MPWKDVDPKPAANTALALAQPLAASSPSASSPAPEPAPRHGVVAFPIGMPPPQAASATTPAAPLTVGPVPLVAVPPAEPAAAKGPVVFAFGAETQTIVCAVSQFCDVALQAGEKINQIIVGDPDHWRVEPADEGAGFAETTHLVIRPTNQPRSRHLADRAGQDAHLSHAAAIAPPGLYAPGRLFLWGAPGSRAGESGRGKDRRSGCRRRSGEGRRA